MRPSPLSCLTAGLFVAFASLMPAHAQAQGLAPHSSILLQESVQADLALTEKQKSQINSIQASFGQKSRETFQALQENEAGSQEFQEEMASLHRENQASLVRVLDKNQKARLKEIELQREGFLAATRSEIASKLKLTTTQTKKIKTIVEEMRRSQATALPAMLGGLQADPNAAAGSTKKAATSKTKKGTSKSRRSTTSGNAGGNLDEMGEDGEFLSGGFPAGTGFPGMLPGGGPPGGLPDFLKPENQPDFARMQEALKKSRDEAGTKIGEVLTAEQKTAFEKLTGKPFDLAKLQTTATEAKPPEVAEPKADDAMKKDAAATKADPKAKTKKSGRP